MYALEAKDVVGTWRLVSSTRKVVATGEVYNTYGTHSSGWITYGRDSRMMVLTPAQRADLFGMMLSYAGTYSIEGSTITHTIDTSWNEVWTGTKTVRDVAIRGDTLVYTTKPAPASSDGKMSVVTLVWQKLR